MNKEPFIIERTYNAPNEKVWKAISDADTMKQWYFNVPEFKPEVGLEFGFTVHSKGREYVHLCKVTEVVPGKKLSYSWRYKGEEGNSIVSFELFDEGENTRLKLTHTGLETFPPVADFARTNFEGGWNQIIGTDLKNFLEPQTV